MKKNRYVFNAVSCNRQRFTYPAIQPTANTAAMKTHKSDCVTSLTRSRYKERMSAKHGCTSTGVCICSTSRLTDFSTYLCRLCAKMQAKLIVREVKVFNCWRLHPYPLSDREPCWGFQSNPQTSVLLLIIIS